MSRYLSPTLQDLVPYTPGDIPRRRSVLKLNTNENPYPPPTPVIEAVRRVADRLQLYPDPNCLKLRQAAAEYYELEPDQIMAGNGSDENLFFALRAFCDAGRPLARPDVTYGCYGVWCGLMHIPQDQVSSFCQFMDIISHSNPYHGSSPILQIQLRIQRQLQPWSVLLYLQNLLPPHRLLFSPDPPLPLRLQYRLKLLSLLPGSEGTSYLRSSLYTYSFPPYFQPLLRKYLLSVFFLSVH